MNKKENSKTSKQPKQKPKTKSTEVKFEISEETLKNIRKYKVDKVFINHSQVTDDNILIPLIINHKVLEYKCHQPKCKVGSEWCGSPIKLLLERINNKSDDLRIKNLRFTCYNCYFVNNTGNFTKLFERMKKKLIVECKICKYNISNMSKTFQEMKVCKICFKNNTNKTCYVKNENLFLNTFDNNLTEDDFNQKTNTIDYTDNVLEMSHDMLTNNNLTTTNNSNKSKESGKVKTQNNKKEIKSSKSTNLINIETEDLSMEDMNLFYKMINE